MGRRDVSATDPYLDETFPVLGCLELRRVPLDLVQLHEKTAMVNHDQTVARLKERGGLGLCELAAILEDRPIRPMSQRLALARVEKALRDWRPA